MSDVGKVREFSFKLAHFVFLCPIINFGRWEFSCIFNSKKYYGLSGKAFFRLGITLFV
jgi:hypothetical protein